VLEVGDWKCILSDAYYLAAAARRGLELLSLDKPMLEVARKEGIKIKEIE
jgi:predicted nucleic acid-binding protein